VRAETRGGRDVEWARWSVRQLLGALLGADNHWEAIGYVRAVDIGTWMETIARTQCREDKGELISCSLGSSVCSDVAVPVWGDSHWVVGGDDL